MRHSIISHCLQLFHMMAHSTSFIVLVAALLINTLSYCSAGKVYCVTPTATSCSSCPHCATLSEYAQEAEVYFTSNTTMVFLPGDHIRDVYITVASVTRLTMRGKFSDNRATVVRNGSVGFSFTNMVDLNIYSLAFTSCNRSWNYGSNLASNSALVLRFTQYAQLVNCSFHDNLGTALAVHNTNVILAENNEFIRNQCACWSFTYICILGCGITAFDSNLTFTGNTLFLKNRHNSLQTSEIGAGAITAVTSSLYFTGTNNFFGNSAYSGGAIRVSRNVVLTFIGNNNFINNSAELSGGAIYTESNVVLTFNGNNKFSGNTAKTRGGAIYARINISFKFIGTSDFIDNLAEMMAGGAISVTANVVLNFSGTNNFINNFAQLVGGAIRTYNNVVLNFSGTNSFINNSAELVGGAIRTYNNVALTFSETNNFTDNSANSGGVILGGAIYVDVVNPLIFCSPIAQYIPQQECFFQLPGQNLSSGLDVKLDFRNNSADDAGSVLYGGTIDSCKLTHGLNSYSSGEVFDMLFPKNARDYNTASKISSYPLRICPCKNNLPNCSGSRYYTPGSVYPGETFQISVVAVGQRDGTVSSIVRSVVKTTTDFHPVNLPNYQYPQQTNNTCTKLNYTVFSLSRKVILVLHPEHSPCSKYSVGRLSLSVNINQTCPPGFNISTSARSCICEPRLEQFTNHCNITNGVGQITRDSNKHFWVGYDHSSYGLILHPQCPFDYCVNDPKVFSLNNTDVQCKYSRSGLLCGHCKEGYSLLLGTHRCKKCPNLYLLLIIPFTLSGVALVFLLLVCKLTVATGTLSGLVFYANIVGVNRTIFLPVESTDALSVFIAWINLDFGIETCFYNGMDAYIKTWLQFVFPVYIWVLVGLMIFISHFSQTFANLLGSNPVYPTYNRSVWFYDANINYINGKHIPLFLVAVLVFFFVFLPYTLLLLFGQWLQAISHLRLFSWVNRLKPFMDSYHAPYKAKHRYWPGLLLVLRFVLLLVFAFNHQRNPNINILAILVGAGMLQLWAWVSGGVYRNWCLDALEGSFALNLIILGAATMYINVTYVKDQREGNQLAVGYTSVSIAFATFIGILTYHILQQVRHTKLWKVPKLNLKFNKPNTKKAVNNSLNNLTESASLDQLRELWLEDLLQPTHSSL